MTRNHPLRLVVVTPLRDDWISVTELIRRLDKAVISSDCVIDVLIIDDMSSQTWAEDAFREDFSSVQTIRVLRLRRNLGHQRAIAVGLVYIQQELPCDAVVVMDADGEDTPEGVVQMIRAYRESSGTTAIFAGRSRRLESISFRLFYKLYQLTHFWLTGISVRVGNFSILPGSYLNTLSVMSELWSHYAATVFKSSLPRKTIPIPKGKRIAGKSKMNFISLVTHGLSAMAVFGDILGIRLLTGALAGSALVSVGIVIIAGIRFFTRAAIPGWATYATGIIVMIMIQLITIATSFTFLILSSRKNSDFIPIRDCPLFIDKITDVSA